MKSNWKYSFMTCTADFIDAIKNDRPPYRSGDEARQVLQIDLAIVTSMRSGSRDVKVNSITDGVPKNLAIEEPVVDEIEMAEELKEETGEADESGNSDQEEALFFCVSSF